MKNNKTMQAGAGERNFTATAVGAGAEGGVVRVHDDSLSEGELQSIAGGVKRLYMFLTPRGNVRWRYEEIPGV